jgi:hypothetical protein
LLLAEWRFGGAVWEDVCDCVFGSVGLGLMTRRILSVGARISWVLRKVGMMLRRTRK